MDRKECNRVFIFKYVHVCNNPKSSKGKKPPRTYEFDKFIGYKKLPKINLYFYILAITNWSFNTIIIIMLLGFL